MITKDDKKLEEVYTESVLEEGIIDRFMAKNASRKYDRLAKKNAKLAKKNIKLGINNTFGQAEKDARDAGIRAKIKVLIERHIPKIKTAINNYKQDALMLSIETKADKGRGIRNDVGRYNPGGDEYYNLLAKVNTAINSLITALNNLENYSNEDIKEHQENAQDGDTDIPYYKNYKG